MQDLKEVEISEVLKALNHEIRREIIRILDNKRDPVPYTVFMEELQLPASSNVAYHIQLLNESTLITKNAEGKYSLTTLGKRSALLIDLVAESETSPFSNIFLGFSQLNPIETLLGAWWTFFFIIGFYLFSFNIIISIMSILLALISIILIVYRTKTLWTLLVINNFIWIFFAPQKRHLLFGIVGCNILGLLFITSQVGSVSNLSFLVIIIGLVLISGSLGLSIKFVLDSAKNK